LSPCGVKVGTAIGGIFLLHYLSLHSARPLTGILLRGARTFLQTSSCDDIQRLPSELPSRIIGGVSHTTACHQHQL